ncbi:MAG: NAD-dependent epimerase/dehydratase family protein [Gemmatimonadaceae bacterium]
MRRVLVTGGAGFIGSHIAEALVAKDTDVTVVDNLSTGFTDNLKSLEGRIRIERLDLVDGDIAALLANDFDAIIHAAANAYIPTSIEDPERDLLDNVIATHRLLAAVRKVSPKTSFVYISTAAVYGEGSGVPITEDELTRPVSPYGVSKLAAEHYVTLYARLYGLKTNAVRLFSVYGPRLRKQVVWDFMTRLAANPEELIINGDGTEERDLNHVGNVVAAVLLVAERGDMTGDVYNVAARDSVSIDELARMLSKAMGINPSFGHTGQTRPGHARSWKADISRLEALGHLPAIGYEAGLADTVAWFRADHSTSAR